MVKRIFKNLLCCIICAVIVPGVFCFIFLKTSNKAKLVESGNYNAKLDTNYSKQGNLKDSYTGVQYYSIEDNGVEDGEKNKKCLKIFNENKDLLVLANRDNPLEYNYNPFLIYICNGRLQASSYLYDALVNMLADAKEQGYSYWIASAYRSPEKQQRLVDEDVNILMGKGMPYEDALEEVYKETMPAGCSEHQTGLALDILCSGNTNMDVSQMEEPGNKWLRENCYKYGFILRYPEDKSQVTGINFEPWHFRYVGKEAAKYITKNHITLEEFYQRL